jgi:hypothetical protein
MFQKVRKFDLHEAKHGRTGRREKRFFYVVVIEKLLMNNIRHNFSSKGNFKNLIKTNSQESVKDVFNPFLILELSEKGRRRKSYLVFVVRKPLYGIGKTGYGMVGTASDAFAAIDAPFFQYSRFSAMDTDGLHRTPSDTICTSLAFFNVEHYGTEMLRHVHPLVGMSFFSEINCRAKHSPHANF